MILAKRLNISFKIISAFIAGIFLWDQVVWAGDLINTVLDQQYKDQSQTFAPDYLKDQQNTAESLISQKQTIEDAMNAQNLTTAANTQPPSDVTPDLKGPRGGSGSGQITNNVVTQMAAIDSPAASQGGAVLSVTTQAGDVIHYKDGAIDYIQKKDGIIIRNITLDENNNLLGAQITHPDGTAQTIASGKTSQIIKPDGTILNYNDDELISSIVYPDGTTASGSYTKDGQGNIIDTILTDSEKASHYDSNNRLTKVEYNIGKTIEYDSGVISKITETDQSQFIFDIKQDADSTFTSTLSQCIARDGTIYRYSINSNNSLTSITVEKNSITATYDKDGALLSVIKDGQAITSDTITQAQNDYHTALALYQQKQQETQSYQTILNNANADLANKTSAENTALANLNIAVQSLNDAQSAKDIEQAAYDNAYNGYINAQSAYDSATTALSNTKTLEAQSSQDLTDAQNTLSAKQTILDNKTAAVQAMQATIANLDSQIQADQASLTQAQSNLTQALSDEQAAQSDCNNAQSDVDAKQAAYNNAVADRQAKETALAAANTDLTIKAAAKDQANTDLQAALQSLTNAQAAKDTATTNFNTLIQNLSIAQFAKDAKQTAYDAVYNDYLAAQSAYNSASAALNNAKAVESQASQDLTTAQNTLAAKQTNLDNKIAAAQAMQNTISSLNNVIQSGQTNLATDQQNLNQALGDEQAAQSDYNNAQADVNAKQTAYNNAVQDRQTKEAAFNTASANLTAKTSARDQADTDLQAAIQNLTTAQSVKDAKQSVYDTACNDFTAAQATYDSANTALYNAKTVESKTNQDLVSAQNALAAKQATLNDKTSTVQAIQTTISDLNNKIQADQASLMVDQQNLNQALSDQTVAQTDYDNAQADVNAKQTGYNNAVADTQAKQAAFNTASANLTAAQQAKTAAVNAISNSSYTVSSYTYSPASTVLTQYATFINDNFSSYDSTVWYKPADTFVTIGSNAATLKGTGSNYNATFYTNQSYHRATEPVLTTSFKVSSASGQFIAALDGYTSSNAYRRIGIFVQSGKIYAQTVSGSTTSNVATLVSTAKVNTNYNLEFDVTSQYIKVYIWAATATKPNSPSYTYTVNDWTAVRPYFSLYSGTATVNSVAMKGLSYNSTYNSGSQLMQDAYSDGSVSTYSYSANSITVSNYLQYLSSPYDFSTANLWYEASNAPVTISNGVATLNGTGSNYNATFYSNQAFTMANNIDVKSTFRVTSTSSKFIDALDGYTSSGIYRRVGVTVQNGKVYIQTVSGSSTNTPATLIAAAKANTNYTVEFQATANNILIYLWDSSTQRPTKPSYTYTVTDWTTVRPYFSDYSGTATVSNMYINYISQTRTIASGSSEYAQILARNQLVNNLNNSIVNLNTAQTTYNTANTALTSAQSVQSQAQQDLATAHNMLATKQTTLNNKIAAAQAIQTTINNLSSEITTYQSQLSQAQQSLNGAISDQQTAQADYNNAQADVDAKQTAYNNAVQDEQAKEAAFNAANATLSQKSASKNQASTGLQTAIQNLSGAQSAKDAKQSVYNTAYDDYTNAKTAYDSANTALTNAKTLEAQTQQALAGAQTTLSAKQTILNNKTAARQAIQDAITALNSQIQSDQASLSQAQQNLNSAISDQQAAQTDYNNAQADVNAKQAAYNSVVQDRQAKETVLSAASTTLAAKSATKDQVNTDLQTAIQNLSNAQIVKDAAAASLNAAIQNLNGTQSAKDTKQSAYDAAYNDYTGAKSVYDSANKALNNANLLGIQTSQNLANAQNTLAAKQTILNDKIAAVQAIQATINNLNTGIAAYQGQLSQAQQNLNNAISDQQTAQADYNNAQAGVNVKQTAYNNAVQDRQAKEAALNTANTNLAAKTTVRDQVNTDLQSAIQNLANTKAAKDASQTAYDSACTDYASSQNTHSQALTNFNNAKSGEDAARTQADSLFAAYNTLLSISSLFPSQDTTWRDPVNELNIASVFYSAERQIQQVNQIDGTTENYSDGLPTSVSDNTGSVLYSYDLTSLNNIGQITIDGDGIKQVYDQYGNLSAINYGGISLSLINDVVTRIVKEDGTIIENATFDTDNNILDAEITRPDGVKAAYRGGVLTEALQTDGSTFYYDTEGNITKLINDKGITYIYSPMEEGGQAFIIANAEDAASIENEEEIVFEKYATDKKLVQARRKNGDILNYSYSDGKTICSDGKTITTYDGNNNIIKSEVLPTEDDPDSTISEYEYNRIRRVYKGSGLMYRYTYEFDADGKEITVIEDIKTGDFKRYKDELLYSVTDSKGMITAYEYDSAKKILKSTATYLGKIINQYTYKYDGDDTVIEDINGIKRTYDKDSKLIYLEEDGNAYAYTYIKDSDGKEEIVQKLVQITDESGVMANYENGILKSIVMADGSILSDFIIVDKTATGYTLEKDGIKYYIEGDHVTKEVRQDGMIIEYYDNDRVKSVSSSSGKIVKYSYEYSGTNEVTYIMVEKDGLRYRYDKDGTFIELIDNDNNHYRYDSANRLMGVVDHNGQEFNLSYGGIQASIFSSYEFKQNIAHEIEDFTRSNLALDNSGNVLKVKLDRAEALDYGDGSDGDLRVEAGQTVVIDGTKNYASVYVAPGATLTVSPWNGTSGGDIELKCTGYVNIEGTIETNAKGYRGGYGSVKGYAGWGYPVMHYMQGESYLGTPTYSNTNNYGGGGGAGDYAGGGAGGSYGTRGSDSIVSWGVYARAGDTYGDIYLTNFYMGSGGGASMDPVTGGWYGMAPGGNGGGKVKLTAKEIKVSGTVSSNGGDAVNFCSGGGSGGSIWISGENINISGAVSVKGGAGYEDNGEIMGGEGGYGRIRIDYGTFTGNIPTPTLYMHQIPYQSQGTTTSGPIAITATDLGYILTNTDTPVGTRIRFLTRTGSSSNVNDGSWSGWVETTKDATGYKINSQANKYFQYQTIFETTDSSKTPSISSNGDYVVKLTYTYNMSFDATAPPNSLIFKEHLTADPSPSSLVLETVNLKPAFNPTEKIPPEIESHVLPNDAVIITKSFKDELSRDVSLQISKDNKFTYIIDGKMASTYQKYDDGHLELLMDYSYDEEGALISVRLPYARDSIDTQIAAARQEIAAERATYLRTLAKQRGLAYTQIRDQFKAAHDTINVERSSLQSMMYQEVTKSKWVGWWIFGWWETYTEVVEVPSVRDAINQLNEQERQLNEQEANAYAALDTQVYNAQQNLIQQEGSALTEISKQEHSFQAEIIKEEATPVILEYYRSILGRDPDETETNTWLATVDYNAGMNVEALKSALLNSDERHGQEAFVAELKNRIKDSLYDYLNAAGSQKAHILFDLGLTAQDIVKIDKKEADAISALLDKQNIHFGKSAFVSLESLLKDNSITYDLEDLALQSILIDIFTGSINSLSEDRLLKLSMYSLSKTASLYGLTLYNTKLNYDELTQAFNSSGKVIVHLKNNHYVVVTNVASDSKISYVEHNRGRDGYAWTVSKEDFQNSWTGYSIVKGQSPAQGAVPNGLESKLISAEQAQRIKGSCLMFLFPLLGAIFGAIAGVTTAAVGAIGVIVAGISAVIGPIISAIGTLISGVAQIMVGIGSQLFSAIQFVGSSLLSGLGQVGAWIGNIVGWLNGLESGIFGSAGFNMSGLGLALGKTVVTTALSIGIAKGLGSLGVNSAFSNILSAFVTGGVAGLFNNGFSALSFITGSLQGVAVQGVGELGRALGIDPVLTHVVSISASAFIGAVGKNISPINGQFDLQGFSDTIGKQIFPTIAKELSFAGLRKTFEVLGVDSRLSYAIFAFSSSLFGNALSGADIATSFSRAINSSIVSIGVDLLEEMNPAFSAIRSTCLMSAVENILDEAGLFNGVFTILNRVASSAFNTADTLTSNIFNGAKTFVELVTEKGPLDSVNSALNSLFTRQTIEAVEAQYGMESLLAKPMNSVVLQDGSIGKELILSGNASMIFDESGELTSIKEGGVTCTGSFVWTKDHGIQMKEGAVDGSLETGYNIWADIDNGVAKEIKINDIDGNEVVKIDPKRPGTSIGFNSILNSAGLTFAIANAVMYFVNTYIYRINQENIESIEQKVDAISAGSLFDNANKFLYALANGIANPQDAPNPPKYIDNLEKYLFRQSNNEITENDTLPIPLYQPTTYINGVDAVTDVLKWILDSQTIYKDLLTKKAQNDLNAYFYTHPSEWNRSVVGMGYSGGLMPLVAAVSSSVYNVKTLVGLGAATAYIDPGIIPKALLQAISAVAAENLNDAIKAISALLAIDTPSTVSNLDQAMDIIKPKIREIIQQSNQTGGMFSPILNPRTELMVNVWGTKDILYECGIADKRDNFLGKNTINIEIVGASHFDYMERDTNNINNPPDAWNITVAQFVADLIINSKDEKVLTDFLNNRAGVVNEGGLYKVRLPGYEAHQ